MATPWLKEDYEVPESPSKFMKLKAGDHKFRILSERPLMGYIDWNKDKKPVRYSFEEPAPKPLTPSGEVKHFWAMIVWNYNLGMVQILEVLQPSIQRRLYSLATDPDFGDPREYDIKIKRTGSTKNDTKYDIQALSRSPISNEILEYARATKVDINELMTGGEPFDAETTVAHTWWQGLEAFTGGPSPRPLPAAAVEASEVLAGIQQENFPDKHENDLPF